MTATLVLGAGPAAATVDKAIQEYYDVSAGVRFKIDRVAKTVVPMGTTSTYRVLDGEGNVLRNGSVDVTLKQHEAGVKQVGDFECVISNVGRPGLQVYPPWDLTADGNSFYQQYLYHLYSIDNARFITGVGWTFQVNSCTTGGGDVTNDYHQWFNGTTMLDEDSVRRVIGTSWPTTVINGALSSSLNFQLGQAPVEVGGSVSVQQQDSYGGNTGPNEHMDPIYNGWPVVPAWNINRVNSFYVGPNTWIWDGSPDFQGNTNQALYEYPMAGAPAGYWGYYEGSWVIRAHCSRITHDCPAFN